eukprot:TRINITY_DN9636_c0_g1_i1.p1 TRINITY_DN9636_c0_g1~~TRINITY_DN9636_c0_g1_i1.p1  ORF type:complete len:256 (-),score=13.93 TRINITY_DN9636_c0_g1_i1:90-857(-)
MRLSTWALLLCVGAEPELFAAVPGPLSFKRFFRSLGRSIARSSMYEMNSNAYLHRGEIFAELLSQLRIRGPYVELGVKRGDFAWHFLRYRRRAERVVKTPNITMWPIRYYLVDTWVQWLEAAHWLAPGNVDNSKQSENMKTCIDRLLPFWPHVSFLQLTTQEAAKVFANSSLGFVYVDARHDFCAVKEELELYWPKLRIGGVMAGDDYYERTYSDVCADGTPVSGGLAEAVRMFAKSKGIGVAVFRWQWFMYKAA